MGGRGAQRASLGGPPTKGPFTGVRACPRPDHNNRTDRNEDAKELSLISYLPSMEDTNKTNQRQLTKLKCSYNLLMFSIIEKF